tara:strand:- start:220 stop:354 length:135 start_codon:yes stop_codon:yes gene_type:complete
MLPDWLTEAVVAKDWAEAATDRAAVADWGSLWAELLPEADLAAV